MYEYIYIGYNTCMLHSMSAENPAFWGMNRTGYQYEYRDPVDIEAIKNSILGHITYFGYTPEQTIFLAPYSAGPQHILLLNTDDKLTDISGQAIRNPLRHNSVQRFDSTNVLEGEGFFCFQDYLLLTKPGDCFFQVVHANTRTGPCVGLVHSGRQPVMSGLSLSWVDPLIALCDSPDQISVVITPGLQKEHHVLKADYAHPKFGTNADIKAYFGDKASFLGDGSLCIDLESYLCAELSKKGIRKVQASGEDTYVFHEKGLGHSRRYTTEHGCPRNSNICFAHMSTGLS